MSLMTMIVMIEVNLLRLQQHLRVLAVPGEIRCGSLSVKFKMKFTGQSRWKKSKQLTLMACGKE
jgi:hypothetical protein